MRFQWLHRAKQSPATVILLNSPGVGRHVDTDTDYKRQQNQVILDGQSEALPTAVVYIDISTFTPTWAV